MAQAMVHVGDGGNALGKSAGKGVRSQMVQAMVHGDVGDNALGQSAGKGVRWQMVQAMAPRMAARSQKALAWRLRHAQATLSQGP